jgi:hypothetical protein
MESALAVSGDFEEIWALIPQSSDPSLERCVQKEELYRDAFGSQKLVEFIVVKMKGEVIGFASFFYLYSTWEGRSIFTDDVIVSSHCSGKAGYLHWLVINASYMHISHSHYHLNYRYVSNIIIINYQLFLIFSQR